MIMITAFVDMETLLKLDETNEKEVTVSLSASFKNHIEVQIPLSIIKRFDKDNELATVSKWKYARYFKYGTVIPNEG